MGPGRHRLRTARKGTYHFTHNGKRYTYGQWPTEDPNLFKRTDPGSISLSPCLAQSWRVTMRAEPVGWWPSLVMAAFSACSLGTSRRWPTA